MRVVSRGAGQLEEQQALLAALSDDLTLPLLQIKTALELLEHENWSKPSLKKHSPCLLLSAENGLQLVEAYRLALRAEQINSTEMEPVAVGAILQDVAHQLTPYAKQYNTEVVVAVQGNLTPVLAHQASLSAALQCLSTSLIRAQATQEQQSKHLRILLGAHRSPDNVISTGVFSNVQGISDRTLRAARSLVGRARQPLPSIPAGAASGVLVADMLCSSMWAPLRAAAWRNMGGLATSVPVSKQLQFV